MSKNVTDFVSRHTEKSVLLIASILSLVFYIWSYRNGYTLLYNDAMAHLNIARFVFDNLQPGLVQLGTVWLPFSHILSLLFIWNDWAWQSGFAGSIFSMLAYIFSVWGIFVASKEITRNNIAASIASASFALNANLLYLQSTPLTESLYLCLFILSIVVFAKWRDDGKVNRLISLGILGFFQVLTRYDGWFVVFIESALVLLFLLTDKRRALKYRRLNSASGEFIIFLMPILLGLFIWVSYNWLIFGNPLAFAFGNGSAYSQQLDISDHYGLETKNNLLFSIKTYFFSSIANVGVPLSIFSILGLVLSLFYARQYKEVFVKNLPTFLLILSPIIFNILSLYLGFSTINIPFLFDYSIDGFHSELFNVRYGIMALPLVSLTISLFILCSIQMIGKNRKNTGLLFGIIILAIIISQTIVTVKEKPISLSDGIFGLSSYARLSADTGLADVIISSVDPKDKILVSTCSFNSVLFRVGHHLDSYLHEGVYGVWEVALRSPEKYVKWIILRKNDLTDQHLAGEYKSSFLQCYDPVYSKNGVFLYKINQKCEPLISQWN